MNPTQAVLEERVAALEGGTAALAVSSGHAAQLIVFHTLMQPGDNFVAAKRLYGGSINQFGNAFKSFGWQVRWADPADPASFESQIDERTRAIFIESLANPGGTFVDIAAVAAVAKKHGLPLIVDNTMASPYLIRPLEHGAAVVMYSATKFIGGHGTSIGGVVIDGGNFPWEQYPDRFPTLSQPDPSYHGAVWTEAVKPLGPIAYGLRMRVTLLRDVGACISPFNAFQLIQGLETLPLRMRAHAENAAKVAAFLSAHPKVSRVTHPSQQDGELKRRADTYLKGSYGSLMGFELTGGTEAGQKFINALKLFYHVANIGDSRSLAIHPASTTHSQLSAEEQLASGVTPGYVRLSVGIEHPDDIIADLQQALEQV